VLKKKPVLEQQAVEAVSESGVDEAVVETEPTETVELTSDADTNGGAETQTSGVTTRRILRPSGTQIKQLTLTKDALEKALSPENALSRRHLLKPENLVRRHRTVLDGRNSKVHLARPLHRSLPIRHRLITDGGRDVPEAEKAKPTIKDLPSVIRTLRDFERSKSE
jgi:hypothetical protein